MVNNKPQHAKAMLDMVKDVCSSIDRDIVDAPYVSTLLMENYERVTVRFDDGFGVELTFNVDDEECTR